MPKAATRSGSIHVGVGGWVYEPWRGAFYPEDLSQKRELAHAAARLTSIEINGTYYGTQKRESFARWRDETPEGFVFSLKGSRYVTNRKVLAEAGPSIEKFVSSGIAELGEKLGPINWQFMPTKRFEPEDLEAFLALLPRAVEGRPLRHAVEARHESFRDPALVALLRRYGVAGVVAGDSDYPVMPDPTADFVYLRIMGTREGPAAGYEPAELAAWAHRARAYAAGDVPEDLPRLSDSPERRPRDVFLYVISGHKVVNPAAATALIEALKS